MSETTKIECPNCGQGYKVAVAKLGQQAACKKCGKPFELKRPEPADDARAALLQAAPPLPKRKPPVAEPKQEIISAETVEALPAGHNQANAPGFFGSIQNAVTQAAENIQNSIANAQANAQANRECNGCGGVMTMFEQTSKLGSCAKCALVEVELIDDAEKGFVFSQAATYKGGLPDVPEEGKQHGIAAIYEDGFYFRDVNISLRIPHERIQRVDQETFQLGGVRAMLAGINAMTLQNVRNTLAFHFLDDDGVEQAARFQINGAMTIPGEQVKANEFLNYLAKFKAQFGSARPAITDSGIDIEARLEKLERLKDQGLIRPDEYEKKREELLNEL